MVPGTILSSPRLLVTAGNTREMIDQVRDWGNVFTGNTGFGIARALAEAKLGEVELLTSNAAHIEEVTRLRGGGGGATIRAATFHTHGELKALLEERMRTSVYAGVFMTAAVSDYRPTGAFAITSREAVPDQPGVERWLVRDVSAGKVKSNYPRIAFVGEQTEKLVDLFRTTWHHRGLLLKFKLEVGVSHEQLIEIGRASRQASGADYLVANTLEMVRSDNAGAYLIGDGEPEWVPRDRLAERMVELARMWHSRPRL